MITEGTWLWLPLFSRLFHSIGSWKQTGFTKSQASENVLQNFYVNLILGKVMFITIVFDKSHL